MANRTLLRDLEPNQLIDGLFCINNCQLGQTRNGKPFLKCLIGDRSAKLPARMWNVTEQVFESLPTDGFVWIDAQSQPYQGQLQLIIQQIKAVEPDDDDLAQLLPSTDNDPQEMFGEVKRVVEWIKDPGIAALIQAYLDDEALMQKFMQAPAAMSVHHAFIGGLVEHTLGVLRLAELICPLYPQLNADIVLAGVFLHDLGKCKELTWKRGFGYSDQGQLVGHIGIGLIWLHEKAQQVRQAGTPLSEPVLQVLEHIVLSHHGEPEFGALKIPATPEAWAVHLLDNVDAKVHMALAATRNEQGQDNASNAELQGNFTEKIWALNTRLYRPNPTDVQ